MFSLPHNDPATFQSTPPSREATRCRQSTPAARSPVSIHAPLTGGDPPLPRLPAHLQVSIHAPLTGGDTPPLAMRGVGPKFQSTPPSREATSNNPIRRRIKQRFNPRPPHGRRLRSSRAPKRPRGFNPRPPHGRRPHRSASHLVYYSVSIHAPLTGGDTGGSSRSVHARPFQSTPPSREATHHRTGLPPAQTGFNPRPPHGRRPTGHQSSYYPLRFQSTPPSREATAISCG